MQTMQENMQMARGMQAGMMGCPMMQGGMVWAMMGGGMGMMGQGAAAPDDMMSKRMEMMEKRMDMMQMMMQGQAAWACRRMARRNRPTEPQPLVSVIMSVPRKIGAPQQGLPSVAGGTPLTAAEGPPADAEYICPMHPEVRQIGPGTCPKCGMALEPVLPELEEGDNPELADFRRRFWWTLPLTVLVTADRHVGRRCSTRCWVPRGPGWNWRWRTPVVLWSGWPFFVRGVQSVPNRSPNMWTLIGLGTGAAYALQRGGHGGAGHVPDLVP